MGHCELRCAVGLKRVRYRHGEVLLWHVLRSRGRWELWIVGPKIERWTEDVGRFGAQAVGTRLQRDHNRDLLGTCQGILRTSVSTTPRRHSSTQGGPTYRPVNLNGEWMARLYRRIPVGVANGDTLRECAGSEGSDGEERTKLHRSKRSNVNTELQAGERGGSTIMTPYSGQKEVLYTQLNSQALRDHGLG